MYSLDKNNDTELLQDIKAWKSFGAQDTHISLWVKIIGRKFWAGLKECVYDLEGYILVLAPAVMWCNQSLALSTKHSSLWAAKRSLQTSPECNPQSVGCLGLEMCKNCALLSSSSFLLAGGGLALKIVHVTDAPVTTAWRNGILLLCVGKITVPEHEQKQSCRSLVLVDTGVWSPWTCFWCLSAGLCIVSSEFAALWEVSC